MKSYMITLAGMFGLLFLLAGFLPALIAVAGAGATSAIAYDRAKGGGKYKQLR